MRSHLAAITALAFVVVTGCSDDEDTAGTTTTTSSPTTTTLPGGDLVACDAGEGITISAPAGWSSAGPCRWFHPEPFEVPEATDARFAAISAHLEPVPFAQIAAPEEERDAERAVTAIDGLQAVRLDYDATGDGLYPPGTPITTYAVDVAPGVEAEPRTLLVDTVGVDDFDIERNRVVLDRMARSIDVTLEGVAGRSGVVARYAGGGGAFQVVAEPDGNEICLHIVPEGDPRCVASPGPQEIATVTLDNLGPVLAGVTGDEVFAVVAERAGGPPITFLTVPVEGADARGFAFAFGPGEVDRLVLTDLLGNELGFVTG